tara:strand:+ start:55 stop:663 length:609 start_codon:yes stop_codon:yes gene_type:complete
MNISDYKKLLDAVTQGTGDSDQHLLTLFGLAIGSGGKTFIELGVRDGQTTLPLVMAAKNNGGKLYSVDLSPPPNNISKEYLPHLEYFQQDAIEFLGSWDKSKDIDFIFIDDWHSYEHVKKELSILDTLVSPRTVIVLHDLMYGNTCPFYHADLSVDTGQWASGGPYRAVAELNPQFWEYATIPYNNGLTLLRKKYSSKYKQK